MIRVDALWLSTRPLDMRAGTETILSQVVRIFGAAQPHHAYLFANRRGNRLKVLVHDGYGVRSASVRLMNTPRIISVSTIIAHFSASVLLLNDFATASWPFN